MTEQEITQARADIAQLDIEQLRCGVMLQLLNIDALTKECDALAADHKECVRCLGEALQDRTDMAVERDAALEQNTSLDARCANLEAAAKLAMDALDSIDNDRDECPIIDIVTAIKALKKAGVQ